MIPIEVKSAAETANASKWARQHQKLPISMTGSPPSSNTRFLGPKRLSPKCRLDQFSHFCRAQERDQYTDQQTIHTNLSVAISRYRNLSLPCGLKTNHHVNTVQEGYMPSLCNESPTHLAVIAAAIRGTMYCRPPVNSNIITTSDTTGTHQHTDTPVSSLFSGKPVF